MAEDELEPRVIVIGGGFAGVACAQVLDKHKVPTLLLDRLDYHQFQPMLYQLATAQVGVADIAYPLRAIFHGRTHVRVATAQVDAIDVASKTVTTSDGRTYSAEVIVIAAGARANFFDVPGAAEHSFPLYSVDDANALRSRIVGALDAVDADPAKAAEGGFSFVVVGGGPTGVETSGAIAEFMTRVAPHFYPQAPLDQTSVTLVDHADNVLNGFSDQAQHYAAGKLTDIGVQLRFGVGVASVHPDGVELSDGSKLLARTVVWAAGEKPSAVVAASGLPTGRGGRIDVADDLSVPGVDGIYALGDAANIRGADGEILPQLGSVAMQSGDSAGHNIVADLKGHHREPFRYHDKGIMAMIGRDAAVAEIGPRRHEVDGPVAFAAWLGVHALLLSGTRQKVGAFIDWGWDYFSARRPAYLADRPDAYVIDWDDDD
jgi:NADH dehydrogenase